MALFYSKTLSFILLRKLGDNILRAKLLALTISWLELYIDIRAISDLKAPSLTLWASRHY